MSKIHKGTAPDGTSQTLAQMEAGEVEWRRDNPDGFGNTPEAVRRDAEFIAGETGADADKVQAALVKRFKPHNGDGDSITRRDADLSDEEGDELMRALFGGE